MYDMKERSREMARIVTGVGNDHSIYPEDGVIYSDFSLPGDDNYHPGDDNYHPGDDNYHPGDDNYHPGDDNYHQEMTTITQEMTHQVSVQVAKEDERRKIFNIDLRNSCNFTPSFLRTRPPMYSLISCSC